MYWNGTPRSLAKAEGAMAAQRAISASRLRAIRSRLRCQWQALRDIYAPIRVGAWSFANRFRIGSIGLSALHVRLDVSRRHQAHLMSELDQLASPVMRHTARLDADQAKRQLVKKWQHLRAPNNYLAGRINAVDLKNVLGQVRGRSW